MMSVFIISVELAGSLELAVPLGGMLDTVEEKELEKTVGHAQGRERLA